MPFPSSYKIHCYNVAPQNKSPSGAFMNRLSYLASTVFGGTVEFTYHLGLNQFDPLVLGIAMRCPHGNQFGHMLSLGAFNQMKDSAAGMVVADDVANQIAHLCKSQCMPSPKKFIPVSDFMPDYSELYFSTSPTLKVYSPPNYGHPVLNELAKACPAILSFSTKCPLEHCESNGPLAGLIPHVNDVHQWPREDIADWLETLDVDLTIQRVPKEKSVAEHSSSTTIKEGDTLAVAIGGVGLTAKALASVAISY